VCLTEIIVSGLFSAIASVAEQKDEQLNYLLEHRYFDLFRRSLALTLGQ
jgi:hypothetical protein